MCHGTSKEGRGHHCEVLPSTCMQVTGVSLGLQACTANIVCTLRYCASPPFPFYNPASVGLDFWFEHRLNISKHPITELGLGNSG